MEVEREATLDRYTGSPHREEKQSVMVHAYNPNRNEVEAGRSKVRGHPGLHREFKDSVRYISRACLKGPRIWSVTQW
jgi:hypothetical protein